GTLMGALLREYWLPAMLSSELPRPDGDPVRVLLLGEQLIGFRDSSGRVGLVAHACPHRGASLYFGRNEGDGLRCVYHGWKFDVTGRCVDMPNEPAESTFRDKVRACAYPCVERGGVVFAYLGSTAVPPPLPDIEANQLPEGEGEVSAVQRECNWLQALEGDIDTSHFGFLHFGATRPEDVTPGTFLYYSVADRAPRYAVVDTDYGSMYGAYRPAGPGRRYWRIAQFLFPCYTHIPSGALGHQVLTRAWVPMDDHHTMFVSMGARSGRPVATPPDGDGPSSDPGSTPAGRPGGGRRRQAALRSPLRPNTSDWYGRFRLEADATNDYRIDREWQRHGDFTGIDGILTQDQAVTESMGPIYDRTGEHLGTSDVMVIRVRRRLLDAARALADRQVAPPGVEEAGVYATRSGGVILPEDAEWLSATEGLRRAYVEHPELDLALETR
ncbi:MAG: Rieske 2Fe-2S domain-containing protein, partial [Acidimicrobiales bacterium]|nr:Rieske 2Fe-2S domain-containing protein [Acidimicrobiales bacterium]